MKDDGIIVIFKLKMVQVLFLLITCLYNPHEWIVHHRNTRVLRSIKG